MQPIIGFDFGNFNSFTCFISDFDIGTRMGGKVYDLNPPRLQEGIPSVYFYSKKVGEPLLGENAVASGAVPYQNRLRYLKRHLGEKVVLDDRTISYDDAIVELIEYCIRSANKELKNRWLVSTNLVSLSYPASYTCAQKQRLIDLVERATLEDGQHLKVFGTIAEPAAAALDYLAEFVKSSKDTTVLTYDLGGGTFDLGLVSVYPKGRKNSEGHTYYYDIVNTRGFSKLGGAEFDEIMYNLLSKKLKKRLSVNTAAYLRTEAENIKVRLSTSNKEFAQIFLEGKYEDIDISREEFEKESRELLMKTVKATKKIIDDHPNQKPELILLTGGASQMPMVKEELEKYLPEYKDKIIYFRPSRAIAYGAARFGTKESMNEVDKGGSSEIVNHVMYDIGIRYFRDPDDTKGFLIPFVPAGSEIPFTSRTVRSTKISEGRYTTFRVFEAKKEDPDVNEVTRDYVEIMFVTVDHGRIVPADSPSESRLIADKDGTLRIEARDVSEEGTDFQKADVQLKNLSGGDFEK